MKPESFFLLCASIGILVSSCGPAGSGPSTPATPPTAEHTHGGHLTPPSDYPAEAAFLDAMILHHQGAVDMAREALEQAGRTEIRKLAETILQSQTAEIETMRRWRQEWFPGLAPQPITMDMGPMAVAPGSTPYDQRFLEAMIPHHEAAVAMARWILPQTTRTELLQLANAIVRTQQAEIEQMRGWLGSSPRSPTHTH